MLAFFPLHYVLIGAIAALVAALLVTADLMPGFRHVLARRLGARHVRPKGRR